MPAGCKNLIGMITDLYGIADTIMELKLSWVQFLKRLSLTDLDQDSEKKMHIHVLQSIDL